ncbi:peptidase, T1 family [Ancylostoma duodenale]|uniref:Proteasome subunit alpha type-1 n=1 Tax=Ancylostoma duodenale TaxID=51022 RepID=A0A0C2DGI2_9BILA|nr:peptidase, T1 family [Ancylostoma duodenale]
MFRNQYDSDVTVWSPQGRLHQVDYAVEAMKQGSATVGIKSETHAVLAALKASFSDCVDLNTNYVFSGRLRTAEFTFRSWLLLQERKEATSTKQGCALFVFVNFACALLLTSFGLFIKGHGKYVLRRIPEARAQNELCSHQKKIYEIDTHAGVSIAGLLSDGRILARFLQTECSSWRWDYKQPVPISSLSDSVQLKLQANTQYYGRRPFGVGLLIAGYDKDGTHIVQSDPSAEVVEMFASSIGARSQSARTYLERHLDKFRAANADELIEHALLALRDTLPAEENLTSQNTSIAIVGKGQPFKIMDDSEVAPHLAKISNTPRTMAQPEAPAAPEQMQQ